MREIFGTLATWLEDGVPFAAATLVETFVTAPAPIGTTVLVDRDGRIASNIGAGCNESEIIEACLQTIADEQARLLRINLTATDAVTGGSGCGGALKVLAWKPNRGFLPQARAITSGSQDVAVLLACEGEQYAFTLQAKPALILVGATALAQEVARMARQLGFFVTVVDPRPAFATQERLPDADALVLEWPDAALPAMLSANSAVVMLSHDPKFDVPALHCALDSPAYYVGLLGSRLAQEARRNALRELGVSDADLQRVRGPAGLNLGGMTAPETALSILAEIVAVRNHRSGGPLSASDILIHNREWRSGPVQTLD
jgi:xanthine dehydrogenase accessory factor